MGIATNSRYNFCGNNLTQIGAIYVINAPVEETQSDKKFCYIISSQEAVSSKESLLKST